MKYQTLIAAFLVAANANATYCDVEHNLPLLTHYDAKTSTFSLLGTDVPDLYNTNAQQEYLSGKFPVYYYANEFLPSKDNYLANKYDQSAPDNTIVKSMLDKVCENTGIRYQLTQPGIEVVNRTAFQNTLKYNNSSATIIHSLVYRNNLFTVILPKNWNNNKTSYPLVINGFYGLNNSLVTNPGPDIMTMLGKYYNINNHGAIAVLWNGNGSTATYTTNPNAYRDLNDFLEIIIPELNINRNKVFALGGSRGAYTALSIASHPAITSVNVRAVWASNPFSDIALLHKIRSATTPSSLVTTDWLTGYYASWENPNINDLITIDPNESSLTTSYRIKKLKRNKTEIILDIGSHDDIIASIDKYKLFEKFISSGVRTEVRLNYLNGHTPDETERYKRMLDIMIKVDRHQSWKSVINRNKIFYAIATEDGSNVPLIVKKSNKPFLLELPSYFNDRVPSQILAYGQPNTQYQITFFNESLDIFEQISLKTNTQGYYYRQLIPSDLSYGSLRLVDVFQSHKGKLDLYKSTKPIKGQLEIIHSNEDIRKFSGSLTPYLFDLIRKNGQLTRNGRELNTSNGIIGFWKD